MTWNHRVMRQTNRFDEVFYQIHEVFYDENGKVNGWTGDGVRVGSEDLDGILVDLDRMAKAVAQPVLDYETGLEIAETGKTEEGGNHD